MFKVQIRREQDKTLETAVFEKHLKLMGTNLLIPSVANINELYSESRSMTQQATGKPLAKCMSCEIVGVSSFHLFLILDNNGHGTYIRPKVITFCHTTLKCFFFFFFFTN